MEVLTDFSRLCVHTITTKPWDIFTAARKFAEAGVKGITVWRDAIRDKDLKDVRNALKDLDLTVVSVCRGGFFPSVEKTVRRAAIEDNLRAIDEASAIGAPMVVLVCGADPRQSLTDSRSQIADGIAACLDHAAAAGVRLTIEPLHPMYAAERSAINTLRQANEIAEQLNSPFVGIAVDVYHLWWDADLQQQLKRCGEKGNLAAFHVCDWKSPTLDMLNDRGLMGEGCINIREIRSWVEDAGFSGFNEVEIFSNLYWQDDQDKFLNKIKDAYLQFV